MGLAKTIFYLNMIDYLDKIDKSSQQEQQQKKETNNQIITQIEQKQNEYKQVKKIMFLIIYLLLNKSQENFNVFSIKDELTKNIINLILF